MTEVHQWRVTCDTEADNFYTYALTAPVTCPNNNTHTVTQAAMDLGVAGTKVVQVQLEKIATQGNWQMQTLPLSCAPGVSTHDFVWDFPINALNIHFHGTDELHGDELELQVAPDSTIGALTADAAIGATVLTVSPTVFTYLNIGHYVKITDGTNTDDVGICLAKDLIASTITIKTPTTHAFSALTPTYVKFTIKPITYFKFCATGAYRLGDKNMGTSYVPTGRIVRLVYTNNNLLTTHEFCPCVEYNY